MSSPTKTSRAEDIYRTLKEEIRSNRLHPGAQIPEPELAGRLDVSRTTLREALIRLEADGLVELIPRRGVRILPLRADDMGEIYEILTALEADVAVAMARKRPTAHELQPLQDAIDAMQRAVDMEDLDAWAGADDRFHTVFLEIHGNRRLKRVVETLSDQAHRARIATLHLRNIPKRSTEEHQAILDAILAGDAKQARKALRSHRARAARELLDILDKLSQL